jgi:hypothetical protein
MPPTLSRILKSGLPSAAFLALVGFLMAEVAGIWFDAQVPPPPANPSEGRLQPLTGEDVSGSLRIHLPIAMAVWGFLLVAAFELVLRIWRGPVVEKKKIPERARGSLPPPEDDVEALLNQLLQQAEAAEAARQKRKSALQMPVQPPPSSPS